MTGTFATTHVTIDAASRFTIHDGYVWISDDDGYLLVTIGATDPAALFALALAVNTVADNLAGKNVDAGILARLLAAVRNPNPDHEDMEDAL